jgi:wobble nucleotide-excising tRNase
MITKISKLKDFGVFQDFSWKTDLPEFKKFNLIYGWNRTGKTTISRVFTSCERKSLYDKDKFRQYPENGEFELKISDNTTIKETDVANNTLQVKVFNQDFIDDHLSFQSSSSCNPIVYISEEDIESKKLLEKLKEDKPIIGKALDDAKKDHATKIETKADFLTDLGREIANILFDKSYNKLKAESKINAIGIDNFAENKLSDDGKKKFETISKSEEGKPQNQFLELQFSFSSNNETIDSFEGIFQLAKKLLERKVVSETLERLKTDQQLNTWVKQGFDLHKTREEKEKCLFCQKPLDSNFLSLLSKHFSKDYEDLQKDITKLKAETLHIKREKINSKNDELHPDLKENYANHVSNINDVVHKLNSWIDTINAKLDEKYNNPLIAISSEDKPDDFLNSYNKAVNELNKIVLSHNTKIINHVKEVKNSKEKLELNAIAAALSQRDYKKMESDIKDASVKEKEALEAVSKNDLDISELENKNSNIGHAIKEINKHLKEFFGREEIKLELDEYKKGYIITREGKLAKNLSEGEKTAIAFSYFLVKVEEKEFKIKDATIFIDDPISSLDSNFTYHCFSLIKNHFSEVGQLVISTHNFQFFNLVKDWFAGKNRNAEESNRDRKLEGKEEKLIPCEFYMIKSEIDSGHRKAKIIKLDETLKNHKSEYSFLFSLLKDFDSKTEDPTFEEIYNIANIGRRFFDIFADFKIPTSTLEQKDKINMIIKEINKNKHDEEKISQSACDKVFWLINSYSHNSDPTSAIEHKDKSESRDAIKTLLNIVRESDPRHYDILNKN